MTPYEKMKADGWSDDQITEIINLQTQGYHVDVQHSIAAASLVWTKGDDFYIMRQGEETLHNPKPLLAVEVNNG